MIAERILDLLAAPTMIAGLVLIIVYAGRIGRGRREL